MHTAELVPGPHGPLLSTLYPEAVILSCILSDSPREKALPYKQSRVVRLSLGAAVAPNMVPYLSSPLSIFARYFSLLPASRVCLSLLFGSSASHNTLPAGRTLECRDTVSHWKGFVLIRLNIQSFNPPSACLTHPHVLLSTSPWDSFSRRNWDRYPDLV